MSNPNQRRDSHGRFKPDHRTRNLAIGSAVAIGIGAAAVAGLIRSGLLDRYFAPDDDYGAPDWALDTVPAGAERVAATDRLADVEAISVAGTGDTARPASGTAFTFDRDRRSAELIRDL